MSVDNGWDASAEAWIASQGDDGDWGRRFVLDRPMLERIAGRGFATALDVGCGEGRFARLLQREGIRTVGIDPTETLIARARALDPGGDYRVATAESMDVPPASFDLVVSYLSLVDMEHLDAAVAKIVAALRPGGTFLLANLTAFNAASGASTWWQRIVGPSAFRIDHYLDERENWLAWRNIRIRNWHRPLERYMQLFLRSGLELRHFAEPAPHGGDPIRAARYRRAPWFHIMEWQKRQ